MPVDHYENFPVASWLCPPRLRPAVTAIYWYARTADDLADEGDATPAERLAALTAYRDELRRVAAGQAPSARWRAVFEPLAVALRAHRLPLPLLEDLLSAFMQDVTTHRYADRAELLDYCRRSANPIGRLLLHLYGVTDARAAAESDAICTALQLVNFWQDAGVDASRGRVYLPAADLALHGITVEDILARRDGPAARAALAEANRWAEGLMRQGAGLVHRLPGRAGWELRLVVQGGLRIAQKIRAMDHATLLRRPALHAGDAALMGLRAIGMRRAGATQTRVIA